MFFDFICCFRRGLTFVSIFTLEWFNFILASHVGVEQTQCNIVYRHNDVYLVPRMQSDTRFKHLATVTLNISVFWDMMPCRLVEMQGSLLGIYCLHLQSGLLHGVTCYKRLQSSVWNLSKRSFEDVAKYKYFGTVLTNRIYIDDKLIGNVISKMFATT
jgi:hypothetical protein